MKNYIEHFRDEHLAMLREQLIFSGLTEHEIFMFIQFSKPYYTKLSEGKSLQIANQYSQMIGTVISGSLYVYSVDYEGNKALLKSICLGETSGTLYSMLDYSNSLLELTATTDSEIIFIRPECIYIADERLASIQQKILVNLLASQRSIFLEITEHLACLSQRSIRDKILRFLKINCDKEHSYTFSVPFSREELANYLAVDRASLSRSLSELKNEGIIDYRKNKFTILTTEHFKYQ